MEKGPGARVLTVVAAGDLPTRRAIWNKGVGDVEDATAEPSMPDAVVVEASVSEEDDIDIVDRSRSECDEVVAPSKGLETIGSRGRASLRVVAGTGLMDVGDGADTVADSVEDGVIRCVRPCGLIPECEVPAATTPADGRKAVVDEVTWFLGVRVLPSLNARWTAAGLSRIE